MRVGFVTKSLARKIKEREQNNGLFFVHGNFKRVFSPISTEQRFGIKLGEFFAACERSAHFGRKKLH